MKSVMVVGVLLIAFLALSSAETALYPRGCIWINGKCHKQCPVGTHSYSTGCGYKTPEPTCQEPNPVPETAKICDYTACYCDPPTVRDQKTDQCVMLADCSPQDTKSAVETPKTSLQPPIES